MTRPGSRRHLVTPATPDAGTDIDDKAVVLRLSGEIDVASCPDLHRQLSGDARRVVVDLSKVTLLSAAAIGVLIAAAERLASKENRLSVVAGTADIRRLLRVTQADDVLEVHDSMPRALTALLTDTAPLRLRGGENHGLRRRLSTQPTVARALGMLQERYDLRHASTAFDVLRTSSQRNNLRLHLVAAAFLSAPAPGRPHTQLWFPGRLHHATPPLAFATRPVAQGANRTAVLDAVLTAVSACMDADAADLQMADILPGRLYLERHRGLTAELVNFLDSGENTLTTTAAALRRRVRLVLTDVATDPILADPTERMLLLAGGSRALQSSPLPTVSGEPVGVVTTHHAKPGRAPTHAEHARLDAITSEAGAWLTWHRRTVILDALEHVHASARATAGRRDG